jgi:hypothetical protein
MSCYWAPMLLSPSSGLKRSLSRFASERRPGGMEGPEHAVAQKWCVN